MFELTPQEVALLVSQTVIPGRSKLGGAVMRAFVRLREMLLTNADLARKLAELERKYDAQFKVVFDAIRQLMNPPEAPERPKRKIGFHTREG